ncbi:MAG: DUF4197 domain-containing protein [Candidatus Omnitrophica bacterium]|nr:DUF4197 domain-containing protein [Candidatus Omnitrophota bacterium]
MTEKAAPEAVTVLVKTATQFKSDDPEAVIKGGPGAATRLFPATHWEELEPQLVTLARKSGAERKLRETYNNVMLEGGGLLGSLLGSGPSVDIESQVAQGLLGAIGTCLAEQEGRIRSDASARQTPALQEAFKK